MEAKLAYIAIRHIATKLEEHLKENFNYPLNDEHIIFGLENEISMFLRDKLHVYGEVEIYHKNLYRGVLHISFKVDGHNFFPIELSYDQSKPIPIEKE